MKRFASFHALSKRPVAGTTTGKLVVGLVLFVALMSTFAYITEQVRDGDTLTRDTEILLRINTHSSSLLDAIALLVTYTGNILSVILVSLVIIVLLERMHKRRATVQVLFTMGGAIMLNAMLKLIFQRDRPELWQLLTHESTYSFPSGHAMLSATLVTLLVTMFWNTRYKWLIICIGLLYVLSVGFSRMYLGVHYPTDVIAGWCIGGAWAIAVGFIIGSIHFIKPSAKNVE